MNQVKAHPTKIRLPALGRHFCLGQLYDCRSETAIKGKSLWSKDVTSKALITGIMRNTVYDVLTGVTFEGKLKLLGIDNDLQASILGNLISLAGSSKYMYDQACSTQNDKVTLQYNCTTKSEVLDIEKLSKEKILCPDVFTNGIATHVVCGIMYGGQAFFVFNSLSTEHSVSSMSLYDAVKALPKIGFENGRLDLSKEIDEQTMGIGCRLYSDFRTAYYPKGYKDAAKLFNSLSHYEGSGVPAVPIEVMLCPLSELDSFAACIVRQVSANIVSQLEDSQNHLDKLVIDCINMTGLPIIKRFPGMKNDIEEFKQLLGSYKIHIQRQIGDIVTRIRTGSLEENALETVLQEKEESPFGRQQLDIWVQQKNVHLRILSQNDLIRNKSYIPHSTVRTHNHSSSRSGNLSQPLAQNRESQSSFSTFWDTSSSSAFLADQSLGNSHDSGLVVCFHVNMAGKNSLTKLMNNYFDYMKNGFLRKFVEVHRSNQSAEYTLKQAEQFKELVEANRFNTRLNFSFVEDNKVGGKHDVYVTVMKNGVVIHRNYQPPSAPRCVELIRSVHNKLVIKCSAPDNGKEYINQYEIQFKEVNGSFSQTAQVDVESLETEYTIQDLELGKSYDIQVRAICEVGFSKWSACSTFRTLPATVPGKPMACHQIPNDVLVQWSKPKELSPNTHFKSYIISVCDVTTGEKFDKETNPQNEERITFSHLITTSSYTFTVKACYEEGETEKSEISDILEPKPNTIMKGKLLANSKEVKNGNPPIYRLELNHTIKKPFYKIRKCELGQLCDGITEKVIMIVGATGAGKTTLINGLVNYVLGVDWKDNFRFQLIVDVEESKQRSQAQSQTKWITSYTLHHREGFQVPYSLTVIDTPGFGDTSGIRRDQEITQQIRNFFTTHGDEGIDHIDAIGFVTQASLPRLTPTQRFIFDQVLALFGKDISENIFLLVTFADGQKPPVLEGVKMAEIPYKKYFKFNNSALYAENGMKKRAQYRKKLEMRDSDSDDDCFDEMFWEMGERSFQTFFKNLNNVEAKSLVLTKDVLNERHRLETYVSGIHQHIRTGLNKLEQLRIEVDVLKRHETDIEMNKDFTYTVTEEAIQTEQIPSGTYITNCLTCNYTCHYPCYISDDDQKMGCAAMDSTHGICMVCPARCVWNVHKNMTYKFVIKSVTKTKTAEELKTRYEAASGGKLTAEDLIKNVIDDFESVQLKVLIFTDEVRKSLERLKEIALKPNPLSTVEYIDILIMSEESQMLPGWKDRRRQLEDVRKQAETLQLLAKPGYDPFEEYKKTYFDMRTKGVKEETIFQTVKKMFKTFL